MNAYEELQKTEEESGKQNKKLLTWMCIVFTVFILLVLLSFGNPFSSNDYYELDEAIAHDPSLNTQTVQDESSDQSSS